MDAAPFNPALPGDYRLGFNWPSCAVKGLSLDQIGELRDGLAALLEIYRWPRLELVQPGAKEALAAWFQLPRNARLLEQTRRELARRGRKQSQGQRYQRRGPTHAERERQSEFGF